jgi:Protein of unknown function (DUF938)
VLEVGSGSGQHVVAFAAALPGLRWLPSDPDPAARRSIAGWILHAGLANVEPPRDLDVLRDKAEGWPGPLVAIVAINLLHVSPWAVAQALLQGAGRVLPATACSSSTARSPAGALTPAPPTRPSIAC